MIPEGRAPAAAHQAYGSTHSLRAAADDRLVPVWCCLRLLQPLLLRDSTRTTKCAQPGIQKSISWVGRLSGVVATDSQGTNTQGDNPRLKLVRLPTPAGSSSGSAITYAGRGTENTHTERLAVTHQKAHTYTPMLVDDVSERSAHYHTNRVPHVTHTSATTDAAKTAGAVAYTSEASPTASENDMQTEQKPGPYSYFPAAVPRCYTHRCYPACCCCCLFPCQS